MSWFAWCLRTFVGRRLPQIQGKRSVSHLKSTLLIHRDKWGIPYIEAASDWDAWFGLGFCHGQDRTFQLDLLHRIQKGRLAELVGPEGIPLDRLARRIGFFRAGEQQLPIMDDDVREIFEAYAMGINEAFTRGIPGRSHEHFLLRTDPLLWSTADVLGVMKLQSFLLAANWDVEMARWMIYKLDGLEALQSLEPNQPHWLPVTSPLGASLGEMVDRLSEEVDTFRSFAGVGGGSNNWAVRANRTETGRPILANDPHLSSHLPAHWYLAHLHTPGWTVAGASFVGTPVIPSGHNDRCAWAITSGLADNTDLYVEQFSEDGRSVREGETWTEVETRQEIIRVRGSKPIQEEVRVTPRGPVITPLIAESSEALSMRASWMDVEPMRGLMTLHKVKSFEDFRRELSVWPYGSMNMVYADVDNTIGWQFAGRVPKRKAHFGLMPADGTDPEQDWEEDPIAFDELPWSKFSDEDKEDFIATANNPPLPEGSTPFLGVDFVNGYRQAQALEKLGARTDWNVENTMELQCDQGCRPWIEMKNAVLGVSVSHPDAVYAQELLAKWNGILDENSVGGAVYQLFCSAMLHRMGKAKAPNSYEWALGKTTGPFLPHNFFAYRRIGHLVRMLRDQPTGWFRNGWKPEMEQAMISAMSRLREVAGDDEVNWGWGKIRPLTFHHVLGTKPLLAKLFNFPPIPFGGDSDTLCQGSASPLDPLSECDNLPSARVVLDVGAWSNSQYCLPSGQSGNPFSPHYHDQFSLWREGKGLTMPWTPEEISETVQATLTLMPSGN